jgi:cyclophilin family peptidyl-prolyl cis-trans isomerase
VKEVKVKTKVFFSISIAGKPQGKITFGLFDDIVPKTADNFKQRCLTNRKDTYKGCIFHRIIKGFMCQSGDFERGDGRGGFSIYGQHFNDGNTMND